jgi:hypothetical protein
LARETQSSYQQQTIYVYPFHGAMHSNPLQRYNKKMRYANKFANNGKIATKDASYS